jgi:hypothetical protein
MLRNKIPDLIRRHQIRALRVMLPKLDHEPSRTGRGIKWSESTASALVPAAELAGHRADIAGASFLNDYRGSHYYLLIPVVGRNDNGAIAKGVFAGTEFLGDALRSIAIFVVYYIEI